jgi:hypothetical protein
MEVGEVRDPEARELRGQAGQADLQLVQPHPGGLVEAPRDPGGRDARSRRNPGSERAARQTLSFSTTGVTGTT